MANKLQAVRGTKDILPEEYRAFAHVVETAREVAARYGFEQIATPIFEFTEVFARTLGDASDIVSKEMYTFEDRGAERLTLRPEFTAGIARAFLSNGLTQNLPLKLFATGPLFRYERPQKGRQRQFHQINFEILGIADPRADAELIAMGWHILSELGLKDAVSLEINSLGDKESREAYREALVEYFGRYRNELSEDSKLRLEKNPLRILDSKDENDKKLVAGAPQMAGFYSPEAKAFFLAVQEALALLKVPYTINPRLVRGLDYYCHTAFEFTTDRLGAQNAVLAGGRYDSLIETMGGPATPAVGFAGGVERLMALLPKAPEAPRPIAVVPLGEEAEKAAFVLVSALRWEGFSVDMAYGGNMGKRMKRADKIGAKAALILGDDELKKQAIRIKWLDSGKEEEVAINEICRVLKQ